MAKIRGRSKRLWCWKDNLKYNFEGHVFPIEYRWKCKTIVVFSILVYASIRTSKLAKFNRLTKLNLKATDGAATHQLAILEQLPFRFTPNGMSSMSTTNVVHTRVFVYQAHRKRYQNAYRIVLTACALLYGKYTNIIFSIVVGF